MLKFRRSSLKSTRSLCSQLRISPFLKKEVRKGVHYFRFATPSFEQEVLKALESSAYDIIQVFNRPGLVAKVKQVSPQSKVVLSLHNLFFGTERLSDEEAKACLGHTDAIVTVSRFVAEHVTRYESYDDFHVPTQAIYSGVDLGDFARRGTKRWQIWRSRVRNKWRIPKQAKVILFAGRLVQEKGCHVLLESLQSIISRHPDVYLLVVGSKWYAMHERTHYIRNLYIQAKSLTPHVIFTSYIPVEQMAKYFAAADLFVCASQWRSRWPEFIMKPWPPACH